jgi:16S rRNA (cytidine1402-2'-O)-methyltransferase
LSVAGLPTDRFVFEGFLPARSAARRSRLLELREESRTLVFFESTHRILACLADMVEVLGAAREAVVARELTKQFETVRADSLSALLDWVSGDTDQQRGEFVVLVHGAVPVQSDGVDAAAERVLTALMEELPLKKAAALTARLTGVKRNLLYQRALELRKDG